MKKQEHREQRTSKTEPGKQHKIHAAQPLAFAFCPLPLLHSNAGYTVVEILVALVLFSLIFLPLAGVMMAESKFQRKYEDKSIAVQIARSQVERIKGSWWALEDQETVVETAGRKWDIVQTVEDDSSTLVLGEEIIQPQYVTVQVRREGDTLALAEFRVLRETYR